MTDPLPRCVRRGMTVRAPPPRHRVLTYPRPPRPGRRVSIVCVPRIGRQITSDLAPRQGRRVMADPAARAGHDRPRATPRAPGADVPLATTAGAPGQRRLRAMATATVALPAGQHRLRQEGLPRVPANPRTLTYPHSHHLNRHSRASGKPRPPGRGDHRGATHRQPALRTPMLTPSWEATNHPSSASCHPGYRPTCGLAPPRVRASHANAIHAPRPCLPAENQPTLVRASPLSTWWRGAGGEARPTPQTALATCR